MNLNPIKQNMTELTLGSDTKVLFSYRTPVAAFIDGIWYRTEKKWSNTTTRHINTWNILYKYATKPQEFFDELVK
jgi:tRNA splicing ligase